MKFLRLCALIKEHANIPNAITVARGLILLVVVPLMFFGIIVNAWTFSSSALALVGDKLDGSLARLLKKVTELGGALDRAADKIAFGLFLFLTGKVFYSLFPNTSLGWAIGTVLFTLHLIALEALLAYAGIWGLKRGLSVESTIWGKIKMALEYTFMAWILILIHNYQHHLQPFINRYCDFPLDDQNCLRVAFWLLFASNIFAVLSIWGYWKRYAPHLGPEIVILKNALQKKFPQFTFLFRFLL